MGAVMKPAVKIGEMVGAIQKAPKTEGTTAKAPQAAAAATGGAAAAESSALGAQRRRRGKAATILTSAEGVGSTPVGTKTLLGA